MLLGARQEKPASDAQTSNPLSPHHHKKPSSLDENGKTELERQKKWTTDTCFPSSWADKMAEGTLNIAATAVVPSQLEKM